jgi:diguanylate cyclase (GGDEF)-like protein
MTGAETLLTRSRPHRARRLDGRELRVEAGLAVVVLAAALALPALLDSGREAGPLTLLLCVVAYAAAAQVPIYVGGGCATPTQLVLVPMLLLLPLPVVPLVVLAARGIAPVGSLLAGRVHPERCVMAAGDAGYVLAPVGVLLLAGEPPVEAVGWALLAGAFAAQCGLDALLAVGREWLGRRIRPGEQLSVMWRVSAVDALALPLGLLVSLNADRSAVAVAGMLPMVGLLALVTRDRNRRLREALDRLDDVRRERERVRSATRRMGRTFASTLDRQGILEAAVGAAVDAVEATAARLSVMGPVRPIVVEAGAPGADDALLAQAEKEALATSGPARVCADDRWALAQPLRPRASGMDGLSGTLAVCGQGSGCRRDDEDLLGYLAAQTAVSLESIELHERLRSQATVDELTGLPNHRRFQEVLEGEIARWGRTGAPVSLVLIDVDDFKRVNDTYGHQVGDDVLRAVAAVLRDGCRAGTDQPARYGGEEMAVVMADTDADGAMVAAEGLRSAVQGLAVPVGDGTLKVTASFGVAECSGELPTRRVLIAAADSALYESKRTGKNRVSQHVPGDDARGVVSSLTDSPAPVDHNGEECPPFLHALAPGACALSAATSSWRRSSAPSRRATRASG